MGLSSCLNQGKDSYTPQVAVSNFVCGTDTLLVRYDTITNRFNLTPFCVEDTVRFGVVFDAVGNTLQVAQMLWDSTYFSLDANFGILVKNNVLDLAKSDTTKFSLIFNPGYTAVSIPVTMVAKHATREASRLGFHIESDSEFSPQDVALYITINEKKTN